MKTKFFLTVNNRGIVKVTKNPTYTKISEISIGCSLELPDVLFKRPQIEAGICVDAKDVQPFELMQIPQTW